VVEEGVGGYHYGEEGPSSHDAGGADGTNRLAVATGGSLERREVVGPPERREGRVQGCLVQVLTDVPGVASDER
jgi:hypothetical protein